MLVLQRNRGTFTGWIIGVLAVAGIVACFLIYGVEARRTRENFDDSLSQRADDVANVVLRPDGSLDTNALDFARDLNTAGIDVYLFLPDGTQLFAPQPQRVANLPALLPLRDAEAGGDDIRTLSSPAGDTRVLTAPIWIGEEDSAHIAVIVQTGRRDEALHALLNKLRLIIALIGVGVVLVSVVGGLFLVRQVMVPVRRSLAQQQAFVANAAHELRTPLSVIQATTELALMRERSNAEYRTALEEIGASVAQTSTMVNDLLTLARIDAGRQPILRNAVDVGDLATVVAEGAGDSFPDHPITTDIGDDAAVIEGDGRLLQRLLVNLVENACHYTPPGTPIAITVRQEREWLALRVRDEGPGVQPAEVEHLFERFYRGTRGIESGHRGAGLGLSLVRQIAEAHGGRVGIASFVDVGTTVTVLLPRSTHRLIPHLPMRIESNDRTPANTK